MPEQDVSRDASLKFDPVNNVQAKTFSFVGPIKKSEVSTELKENLTKLRHRLSSKEAARIDHRQMTLNKPFGKGLTYESALIKKIDDKSPYSK